MGNKLLTVRQQEVFDLLVKFQKEHGYPPSNAEVARMMGAASVNAAADMLRSLQRKGAISIAPGVSRGITINSLSNEALAVMLLRSLVKGEDAAREQAIDFLQARGVAL
ncbi:LexA family transcriptional regulator [Enterobacter sp. DE0047]|uniref:LexA family protein n=1 Tax=Enterobacter sp. DE0047 TaxID=2584949 RepID=UPI00119CCAC8|nr:LexA family transcriptional regulator [Enterobacter sp. DE0047]